ncbi:MAG: alpha/beta fold hydrolase [Actinobacteria bacterium]|nr:alpha/beta fold hydrolase [Actinomycetota bacterium]
MTQIADTKRIVLGDIETAYREEGTGPLVVLIHGLAQDHRMWNEVQAKLSGFRTIAYDVRGHGGTTVGEADGTLAQLGGDLIHLLERTGPAWCVGFSLGGTVALWAAAQRADLIPGVVALATSSVVGSAAAKFFDERIALFEGGDAGQIAEATRADTEGQLGGAAVDLDRIVADRLQAIGDGAGYVNAARAMAAIHEVPLNSTLEQIRRPVLVLSGERDRFCPRRAAEIMLEHLAQAEFEELPRVGHLVTDEDPGHFTETLVRWLDREAR